MTLLGPRTPGEQAAADQKNTWAQNVIKDIASKAAVLPSDRQLNYIMERGMLAVTLCPWNPHGEYDTEATALLAVTAINLLANQTRE